MRPEISGVQSTGQNPPCAIVLIYVFFFNPSKILVKDLDEVAGSACRIDSCFLCARTLFNTPYIDGIAPCNVLSTLVSKRSDRDFLAGIVYNSLM